MMPRPLMPRWRLALCAAAIWLFTMAGGSEARFLADLTDIPLAEGLSEVERERLVFDKPEGRIVRTAATGKIEPATVLNFYRATLPQLGWLEAEPELAAPELAAPVFESQAPGDGRLLFLREDERLEISLETVYEHLIVRFFLEPRS